MFVQQMIAAGFVIGGFLIGWIIEKALQWNARTVAARTRWKNSELVLKSFRGIITLWLTLLGIYLAALTLRPFLAFYLPGSFQFIGDFLRVNLIISVAWLCTKVASSFMRLYLRSAQGRLPSASLFVNLARFVILGLGIIIALQTLGFPITPLLTTLGVGGLAVALALQDTLSNFFSGIYIILSRQIRPGQYIRLDTGEEGYVVDVAWRNTTIRELPNNLIVVPNSKIATVIVRNYHLPEQEMSVLIDVGVSYDSDLEFVEQVTVDVAKETLQAVQGGVNEFEPFIRYNNFADFSIKFTVILRAREFVDQFLIKHEFVKRLHRRYREEGITIPFPIRTVYTSHEHNGHAHEPGMQQRYATGK